MVNFQFSIFNFQCNRGFTLIEVIISISLIAVILTALYSTFFMSTKAIEGLDEFVVKLHEVRTMMDSLRKEFESILYTKKMENTNLKILDRDHYGRQTSGIYFTSFGGTGTGVRRIGYYVKEKDKKLVLSKKIESIYGKKNSIDIEIVDEIKEFSIEVINKDLTVRTWDTSLTKKMPEAIRVIINIPVGDEDITMYETIYPKKITIRE